MFELALTPAGRLVVVDAENKFPIETRELTRLAEAFAASPEEIVLAACN